MNIEANIVNIATKIVFFQRQHEERNIKSASPSLHLPVGSVAKPAS